MKLPDLRLILFDVDGTLLDCGDRVRPLFGAALREVYGTEGGLQEHDFVGKTDDQTVLELLTAAGLPAAAVEERLPEMRRRFVELLDGRLDPDGVRLLPGVRGVLDRLAARPELTLGLLTGNWERGARIKLGRAGLNGYFGFGAFGDDRVDRRALPPVALGRAARAAGRSFDAAETLIVGDSVRDVDCGHAHGIPVLAVATGRTPAVDLERAGAEWVVPDLESAWPPAVSGG